MHSNLVRIQNVFGFFTTVAFCLGALIALSVVFTPQTPSASLQLRNVQVVKGRPHYYSPKKEEYAHITFDLSADLSSLFTWNTKQIFAYITVSLPSSASSSSTQQPPSEAIIWDAILPHPNSPFHPNTYIHPPSKKDSKTLYGGKDLTTASRKAQRKAGLTSSPRGTPTGTLNLVSQKPKYQITTPWGKIAGAQNCTLTLRYNIQPWVGALTWGRGGEQGWGVWKGMEGEGVSEGWQMPEVRKKEGSIVTQELKTETGAEGNRGSPA